MREFRKRFGLTQTKAAKVLGYADDRQIRRIETGENKISGTAKKAMEYYERLAKLGKLKDTEM